MNNKSKKGSYLSSDLHLRSKDHKRAIKLATQQLSTLHISKDAWDKIVSREASRNPFSDLIEDTIDLIHEAGFEPPNSPDERTPAEIDYLEKLIALPRPTNTNPLNLDPNDPRTKQLVAESLPLILAINDDLQTRLWGAYRALMAAVQCREHSDIDGALNCCALATSGLIQSMTKMIIDNRSNSAKKGAAAKHATDYKNEELARNWYIKRIAEDKRAGRKPISKDAAAGKIKSEGVVHASYRTIRSYLTNQ